MERVRRIDVLRGVAIIAIVLYHSLWRLRPVMPAVAAVGTDWIDAFALPLFAFLTGYVLFRSEPRPLTLLVKRTQSLLIPYVCWEWIYYILHGGRVAQGLLPPDAFAIRMFLDPHAEGRMWYLYILFACLVGFALVRSVSRSRLVLAASAAAVALVPYDGAFRYVQWLYPFIVMGFLWAGYRGDDERIPRWAAVLGGIAYGGLVLLIKPQGPSLARATSLFTTLAPTMRLAPAAAKFAYYGLRVGCALGAIALLWYLADRLPERLARGLRTAGNLSMGIYASHFLFIDMVPALTPALLPAAFVFGLGGGIAATRAIQQFPPVATVLLGHRPKPTKPPRPEEPLKDAA